VELSDLRIFLSVVEHGGIIRSARALHRVPSNITTRIKQLEASIGTQLFYRDKQRLHLSPSGELLSTYARRLLQLSDEALGAITGSAPKGLLRLGALESTTASRLPRVLAGYHKAYPDVKVELTSDTNDALVAAVLDRRVDAAFVAEVPADTELSHMPLFAERLTLITAIGHRRIRGPQDVIDDSVIAFPHGCAYRRRLYRWLGESRAAATRVLDLDSYHAIVACVGSGTGIAVVPESVLDALPLAQISRHPLPRQYALVVTPLIWRTREQSRALVALREQLKQATS
jgi:DNA-binding transcriptional LysR family regulator